MAFNGNRRFLLSSDNTLSLINGAQIGMIGDSITVLGVADNASANLTTLGTTDKSEILWAQFFLPVFRCDIYPSDETTNTTSGVLAHKYWSGRIMGTGGDKSYDTRDRISLPLKYTGLLPNNKSGETAAATLARSMTFFLPNLVIWASGTNNLATGDTIMTDIQAAFSAWKAAGKSPTSFAVATIRPFGASTDSGSDKAQQFPIRNNQIRAFCLSNGLLCVDLAYAYCGDYLWHPVDGSDPVVPGTPWQGNLHPTGTACMAGGKYIANLLLPYFSPSTTPFFDGVPQMANANINDETGGGNTATVTTTSTISGTRTARWLPISSSSGSTCVCTVEDNGDGTKNQVLTITPHGPATSDTFTLQMSIAVSVVTPVDYRGTWMRAVLPVNMSASDYWGPVRLTFSGGGGNRGNFAGDSAISIKATVRNGWLVSQPFLIPSGAATVSWSIAINVMGAAAEAAGAPPLIFRLYGRLAGHGARLIPENSPIPTGG